MRSDGRVARVTEIVAGSPKTSTMQCLLASKSRPNLARHHGIEDQRYEMQS